MWRTEEFLRGLEETDDFYMERLGVVKMDSWSRGRVALVGDAAHCPSGVTGMGTTCAMVGAYILAGEIERHCGRDGSKDGLAVALKEYDRKLRLFTDRVQWGGGVVEGSSLFDLWPTSWFGITVVNIFLRLVTLLRLTFIADWLFREDGGDVWQLPEYEEMVSKVK